MSLKLKLITLLWVVFAGSLSAQTNEGKQSITVDELKNHMYFLASDFLGGRVSYEIGYNIAAEYCASQFKSIGLEPVLKDKKGNPTYFQEIPLIKRTLGKDCSVALVSSKGTEVLKSGEDFKIPDKIMNLPNPESELVFIGYGIEEPKYKWNDFAKTDVTNKTVIVLMGAPRKNSKPLLPDSIDKKYQSLQGIQVKAMNIIKKRPASIILIPDKELMSMVPWTIFPNFTGGDQYSYALEVEKDEGFKVPIIYLLKPESMDKLFKNQVYSPVNIEKDGIKGYKTYQFNDLKLKSDFTISESDTIYTKNIVGVLKGSDQSLNKAYISISSHLDHVPMMNNQVCNGADDNASGSISILELAEAMVSNPPRRSVLFSIFAAEELGLIGSYHFVNHSPVPIENIGANINLDMIGRTSPENEATKALYILAHKEYLDDMTKLIGEVNKSSVNWPLIFENCEKLPGDSDHSSFHDKGIPNVHFFSGMYPDLHSPADDAEKIDYEKMQKITQLVYDLTYKLSNMDQLPFAKK